MATSHDEEEIHRRPEGQRAQATSNRRDAGFSSNTAQKLSYTSLLLPIIAVAIFGQIASFDRHVLQMPDLFETSRGPAYPAAPVVSELLPPPAASHAAGSISAGAEQTLTVSRGDTLQSLLTEGGVSWDEAEQAVAAIRKFFDPRDLHVGQQLSVTMAPAKAADKGPQLAGLSLAANVDRMVVARRQSDGGFASQEVMRPLKQVSRLVSGRIESSLFEAAAAAEIRPEIIVEMIRLFSYDIDFQRDIQPGDSFDVLYDRHLDENGRVARTGEIRYAALTLGGKRKELYRFTSAYGGEPGYFDQNGHGAQKALMKTPVDGAKLSSRFGMRKHPILGYTRMHKGLDFAAAAGTPVMAAGQGFVDMAGWNGAYGKYIRIRHNDGYSTAYGHLSGFGKGVRKGARVRQGQIIGYTGSTGRSTGPHLHYEVLVYGNQVNPQSVKLPTVQALSGKDLAQFTRLRGEIGQERASLLQKPEQTSSLQ